MKQGKRMADKPYELSADDFRVIRAALRVHHRVIRKTFGRFNLKWPNSPETRKAAEEFQTIEALIERFDDADNVWMEINV
jgi:hypothetical protein